MNVMFYTKNFGMKYVEIMVIFEFWCAKMQWIFEFLVPSDIPAVLPLWADIQTFSKSLPTDVQLKRFQLYIAIDVHNFHRTELFVNLKGSGTINSVIHWTNVIISMSKIWRRLTINNSTLLHYTNRSWTIQPL